MKLNTYVKSTRWATIRCRRKGERESQSAPWPSSNRFLGNNETIASCLNVVLRVAIKGTSVYMAFKAASHI